MRLCPTAPLLLVTAAAGCDHVVDGPRPPERLPLIEAVLVAGSDVSRFRLRWLDPDDGEILPPILPEDVALDLRSDDGSRATWAPDPDSAGIYLATLPITPAGGYRLGGTIAGRRVGGLTRVPGQVTLEPAGDTLFVDGAPEAPPPLQSGRIVVRWRADGATVLVLDSATVLFAAGFTHSGDADLGIRQTTPGQRAGPTIRFLAMNRDGDRYHFNLTGPETNLTGAFGVFGAAADTRRTVAWR